MQLSLNGFYISPIQLKDAWSTCNFIVANEDRLKLYFPKTLKENLNPALSNIFVEKKVKQFELKEEFLFTIKENETNRLIGLVYLKDVNWKTKQAELAYCIDYNFEGRGITTKAISALSDYAFSDLELETLQIVVQKTNIKSIQVATNNNFIWKKTLINEFTPIGKKSINMELYELYNEVE